MVLAKKATKWLLILAALLVVVWTISRNNQLVSAMDEEEAPLSTDGLAESRGFRLTDTNILDNNCRFGASGANDAFAWTDTVGIGWVSDYGTRASNLSSPAYVPIVRLRGNEGDLYQSYTSSPPLATVATLAAQYPGRIWQVGNEPEVKSQDNMMPQLYARAYHDVYHTIKQADPTARVSIAPPAQFSPARQDIYEQILDSYYVQFGVAMPIDVWNTHLYLFHDFDNTVGMNPDLQIRAPANRTDPSLCLPDDVMCYYEHDDLRLFEEQLIRLRQWLKDQGYQDKPLIISEWSLLYPYTIEPDGSCFLQDEKGGCFTPDRVNAYMDATIEIMNQRDPSIGYPYDNNRLVQQYMWFSYYVPPEFTLGGGASSILAPGFDEKPAGDLSGLTPMGLNYRQNAFSRTRDFNLHAIVAEASAVFVDDDGTADATLRLKFTNNGNSNIQTPFTVGFYRNANLTQLIGEVVITPIAMGCGVYEYEATVEWTDLSPGWHNFWAKLDADNVIGESDESSSDNVERGRVYVGRNAIYSPVISTGR